MKNNNNNFYISLLICLYLFLCFSCKDSDVIVKPKQDYKEILTTLAEDVILQTYTDLNTNAQKLHTALTTLKNEKNEANLLKAKQAWVNTRSPWELSEGFIFGPVETKGLDPSVDSWPVNVIDLQKVLNGNTALSQSYIVSLEGTLKGFHTIEYLLWGSSGNKSSSNFTLREFDYLLYTSQALRDDTQSLLNEWQSTGRNFVDKIKNAGEGQKLYPSQKSALEELAKGIVNIADEVGNGKINDPLSENDQKLEESRFSHNSKKDFADNIRSIQNIYLGKNDKGLSQFVISQGKDDVDKEIKDKITNAINGIEQIPGTFTAAIPSGSTTRNMAIEAQKKVRELHELLESKLLPIIRDF